MLRVKFKEAVQYTGPCRYTDHGDSMMVNTLLCHSTILEQLPSIHLQMVTGVGEGEEALPPLRFPCSGPSGW